MQVSRRHEHRSKDSRGKGANSWGTKKAMGRVSFGSLSIIESGETNSDNPENRERDDNRVEPTPSVVVERIAEAVEFILG